MSRSRVIDWHKRYKRPKKHAEVKGEDDVVRLLRPQGHRSPRNCSVGYHREPALLQGMSTSTSSTLLQILRRLISRVRRIRRDQAVSLRDQELNAGSRPTHWRMLPSVSSSSWPRSRSQCLSTLRTNQPSLRDFWLFQNMKNVVKVTHFELWPGSDEVVKHGGTKGALERRVIVVAGCRLARTTAICYRLISCISLVCGSSTMSAG